MSKCNIFDFHYVCFRVSQLGILKKVFKLVSVWMAEFCQKYEALNTFICVIIEWYVIIESFLLWQLLIILVTSMHELEPHALLPMIHVPEYSPEGLTLLRVCLWSSITDIKITTPNILSWSEWDLGRVWTQDTWYYPYILAFSTNFVIWLCSKKTLTFL